MLTIAVTPELEQALEEQARLQGTTPELLALDSLRRQFLPGAAGTTPNEAASEPHKGETMADFLAGYVGVLHSSEHVPGGARMSEAAGAKFAAGLEEKRRAGKL